LRTCPRCGAQVEVYRTTCDCGFSWASPAQSGSAPDIYLPGEFRPLGASEQPRRASLWPWVLGITLIVVCGWHVLCTQRLEASIHEYLRSNLGDSPSDATVEIHIQPITNLVAIELKVVDKSAAAMKPSERLMLDAALSYIRSEVEPYLERELTLMARKQVDPYAMALPYRIAFSLEFSPK
jgi:hypothetical protein